MSDPGKTAGTKVQRSRICWTNRPQKPKKAPVSYDAQGPEFDEENFDPPEPALKHRYDVHRNVWITENITIRLNPKTLGQGCMRTAFPMKDLSRPEGEQNTVAKMSKNVKDKRDVYFLEVRMQARCEVLATEFNKFTPPKPIEVIESWVVECKRRRSPHGGCLTLVAEPVLLGKYKKWSNNYGFVDAQTRATPHAFSHFTFHFTKGELLVCDIQGVDDTYTDPQIHSICEEGWVYGKGDFGRDGIAQFFQTHTCSMVCQYLRLPAVENGKIPKPDWPILSQLAIPPEVTEKLSIWGCPPPPEYKRSSKKPPTRSTCSRKVQYAGAAVLCLAAIVAARWKPPPITPTPSSGSPIQGSPTTIEDHPPVSTPSPETSAAAPVKSCLDTPSLFQAEMDKVRKIPKHKLSGSELELAELAELGVELHDAGPTKLTELPSPASTVASARNESDGPTPSHGVRSPNGMRFLSPPHSPALQAGFQPTSPGFNPAMSPSAVSPPTQQLNSINAQPPKRVPESSTGTSPKEPQWPLRDPLAALNTNTHPTPTQMAYPTPLRPPTMAPHLAKPPTPTSMPTSSSPVDHDEDPASSPRPKGRQNIFAQIPSYLDSNPSASASSVGYNSTSTPTMLASKSGMTPTVSWSDKVNGRYPMMWEVEGDRADGRGRKLSQSSIASSGGSDALHVSMWGGQASPRPASTEISSSERVPRERHGNATDWTLGPAESLNPSPQEGSDYKIQASQSPTPSPSPNSDQSPLESSSPTTSSSPNQELTRGDSPSPSSSVGHNPNSGTNVPPGGSPSSPTQDPLLAPPSHPSGPLRGCPSPYSLASIYNTSPPEAGMVETSPPEAGMVEPTPHRSPRPSPAKRQSSAGKAHRSPSQSPGLALEPNSSGKATSTFELTDTRRNTRKSSIHSIPTNNKDRDRHRPSFFASEDSMGATFQMPELTGCSVSISSDGTHTTPRLGNSMGGASISSYMSFTSIDNISGLIELAGKEGLEFQATLASGPRKMVWACDNANTTLMAVPIEAAGQLPAGWRRVGN